MHTATLQVGYKSHATTVEIFALGGQLFAKVVVLVPTAMEYRWVYSRFRSTAIHKDNGLDASDGGMAFTLAIGDFNSNFSPELRDFL